MMQTLVKHHRLPDGAECVYNPCSGAYDLPVEKWRYRAFKNWKKKLEELERKLKEVDP